MGLSVGHAIPRDFERVDPRKAFLELPELRAVQYRYGIAKTDLELIATLAIIHKTFVRGVEEMFLLFLVHGFDFELKDPVPQQQFKPFGLGTQYPLLGIFQVYQEPLNTAFSFSLLCSAFFFGKGFFHNQIKNPVSGRDAIKRLAMKARILPGSPRMLPIWMS